MTNLGHPGEIQGPPLTNIGHGVPNIVRQLLNMICRTILGRNAQFLCYFH